MEDLKNEIIKQYTEFLEENNLENNIKSILMYIDSIFYDIENGLEINRIIFNVPKDIDELNAIHYINKCIKSILIGCTKSQMENFKEYSNKVVASYLLDD